jgi:hypothetical protein
VQILQGGRQLFLCGLTIVHEALKDVHVILQA